MLPTSYRYTYLFLPQPFRTGVVIFILQARATEVGKGQCVRDPKPRSLKPGTRDLDLDPKNLTASAH